MHHVLSCFGSDLVQGAVLVDPAAGAEGLFCWMAMAGTVSPNRRRRMRSRPCRAQDSQENYETKQATQTK
jgi:hypothetical protein